MCVLCVCVWGGYFYVYPHQFTESLGVRELSFTLDDRVMESVVCVVVFSEVCLFANGHAEHARRDKHSGRQR